MPRKPKPDPTKRCAYCNTTLTRKRFASGLEDMARFMLRKFCGRPCMAAWQEGRIKVATPKNSRRQSCKKRKTSCENCGSTKRLASHHIDGNPLNNADSNLKTLCAVCHMQTHWREWKATTKQPKQCAYCSSPARHLGLCNTHYSRYRRHGDPLVVKRFNGHGKPVYLKDSE